MQKIRTFEAIVTSTVLYLCAAYFLNIRLRKRTEGEITLEKKCLEAITGVRSCDRVRNKKVRKIIEKLTQLARKGE